MASTAPEDSLARCAVNEDYLDTFYELFFSSHPAMKHHFSSVDMAGQKQKLASSLPQFLALPLLGKNSPELLAAVEKHRGTHLGRGSKEGYQIWVDTVCQTFRRHDPEYSDSIDCELRQRLTTAVELVRGQS